MSEDDRDDSQQPSPPNDFSLVDTEDLKRGEEKKGMEDPQPDKDLSSTEEKNNKPGAHPSPPREFGKGTRKITKEEALALVDSFRRNGKHFKIVAEEVGMNYRTVKRAWEKGMRKHDLPPISAILEAEKAAARRSLAEEAARAADEEAAKHAKIHGGMTAEQMRNAREAMSADAIKGRTEEANMVRLARGDVSQTLAAIARMLPGLQKWAKSAAKHLEDTDPKNVTDALKIIESVSRVIERTAGAADRVMAMERRLLGQAETIVGVQMPDLSMEEAMVHLSATSRTIARAKRLGLVPDTFELGEPLPIDVEGQHTQQTLESLPDILDS